MTFVYVSIFLILWTIASITWFLNQMGKKTRGNQWYDYPLCPPALLICGLIGVLGFVVRKK